MSKIFMSDNKHKPVVNEIFADNGEHSHWELVDSSNGKILWNEAPLPIPAVVGEGVEDAAKGWREQFKENWFKANDIGLLTKKEVKELWATTERAADMAYKYIRASLPGKGVEAVELIRLKKEMLDYGEWARANGEHHRGNLQKNGEQLYQQYLKDKNENRWHPYR